MNSDWRPTGWIPLYTEDWVKQYGQTVERVNEMVKEHKLFEAGASAMLEMLRTKGIRQADTPDRLSNRCWIDGKWVTGIWIFIPDDPSPPAV